MMMTMMVMMMLMMMMMMMLRITSEVRRMDQEKSWKKVMQDIFLISDFKNLKSVSRHTYLDSFFLNPFQFLILSITHCAKMSLLLLFL